MGMLVFDGLRESLKSARVVSKARRKWKHWRSGRDTQAAVSWLARERDAALQELEHLRERYLRLEKRAIERNLVEPCRALFVYPEQEDVPKHSLPIGAGNSVTKQARGRIVWNGLSDDQAFHLEMECLRRVGESQVSLDGRCHFPQLLTWDATARSFTTTHNGTPLDKLQRTVSVPAIEAQLSSIAMTLEKASVAHLDIAGGKNVTVDEAGTLCLIDFDIACLDGFPLSEKIQRRYEAFLAEGGYAGFIDELRRVTLENPMIEPA
ncbi:hypothetical protein [Halomonas sp. KM-1]|uniref:hypothetical protein n=1 Tax=Halomonas sp. KM-1 TaxID=590061 RepID=UPI001146358D|nr:hypothetical protein [Halomonas sp. KM-1]